MVGTSARSDGEHGPAGRPILFAIFAVIAVAILAGSGMLFLWWQRRKMRKGMHTDIVVTDYREIRRPRSPFDDPHH
ncbi:hypothetical protein GGI1_12218 [Acidithiobacillus sp. GGI-221]|nr:hypothetical protein GGI1_12218 [Acidithiobacillus sp. GGI-221]